MKRTWTIIGVKDVPASFTWYQSLFGQPATRPGHPDFGQILDSDGTVLLCLHQWGVEDHPSLMSPAEATPGNGLLLFFRVDDFDAALKRARALTTRLAEDPHMNPGTRTPEFSLRDPDGYYVTISALQRPGAGHDQSKGATMATGKQRAAARRNIKKAATAAKRKPTISTLPKKTRTALGKEEAKAAKRERRSGGA